MSNISYFLNTIKKFIFSIDLFVSQKIDNFFLERNYFSQNIVPQLASKIPILVKLVFYFTILLAFLFPLKIFFPESRLRSRVTYLILVLIILGVFGIFLGFFQLMYSF